MIDPEHSKLDRFLMFVPGFSSWLMIFMPVWLGIIAPRAASFILTFIAVYWVYLAISHTYNLYRGYYRYKKEASTDWFKKLKELNFKELPEQESLPESLDQTKHLILIPTVREGFDILKDTFGAIIDQNYPTKNILVVIGTEESGQEQVGAAIDEAKKFYGDKLPRIWHFIHPKGIPGEIVGVASPNRTWAAKSAVKQLQENGEDIKNYIFTTYDSDWKLHKEFIPRLTYAYLTDEKRLNRFYETAVHLFSNNLWDVPAICRIEAHNITLGMLANWTFSPFYKESFSCYSSALKTLIDCDYWDTTMIDDTVFYWRAFMARDGDFSARHFYIPIYGDATGGDSYIKAHKNLYKQLERWGWGSITTVIALKTMITQFPKKATFEDKFMWVYYKLERHLILRTSVFLMTFGFTLLTFVNVTIKNSTTVYALPQTLSLFLTASVVMLFPIGYVKYLLYKDDIDKRWPLWRKSLIFVEGPVIIINLLTFSFIPWLWAETQMMFGKLPKVTFYTPKSR